MKRLGKAILFICSFGLLWPWLYRKPKFDDVQRVYRMNGGFISMKGGHKAADKALAAIGVELNSSNKKRYDEGCYCSLDGVKVTKAGLHYMVGNDMFIVWNANYHDPDQGWADFSDL